MFVAEAIESAVRNITFQMSRGEQRRDLIFVSDIVSGIIAAASVKGIEGQVINLGTGRAHQLRDVAEAIWKITKTEAPLAIGARPAPQEELHDTWADITIARRLLDWEPQVDLESGLQKTIRFMREQLETDKHLCQTK
jgi:dTDP-glucose 4,6-dehydratase